MTFPKSSRFSFLCGYDSDILFFYIGPYPKRQMRHYDIFYENNQATADIAADVPILSYI